ncbi:CBF-domain-containing protein [Auriscalpium vulgare]|uniref:CBF-domain-containing protein n=1 Tax=Auriscalpium vulgare TaxID=40419 RepID=A0ACB8S281_9AGAM|nr:CBF-domain-containing protein [Auriscalpium vulgare]
MARLRKEKGEKAKVAAAGPSKPAKHAKAKRKSAGDADLKSDLLRDQILALGGDEGDMELLKDVDDAGGVQLGGSIDKNLARDVSNVLKGLNLSTHEPSESPTKGDTKKDKSGKKTKPEKADETKTKKPAKDAHKKQAPKPEKVSKAKPADAEPSTSKPERVSAPAAPPASSSKLLVPAANDWYNVVAPLGPAPSVPTPSAAQIASLTTRAATLHSADLATHSAAPNASLVSSSSDHAFLKNILASGTLSDRLSALTLMVQSSPVHNTRALETLKGMAEKGKGGGSGAKDGEKGQGKPGGRDERLKAARAIVDWWVGGGAPGRKLKYFRDQPLLHPDVTDQHLVLWYFEDWMKKFFFSFLQILEALSLDTLIYVRTQALSFIFTLLRDTPEQEHNLMRLLVNKLGDTEKSICSRASYHLLQLLQAHPAMKSIVIRETTALIMRPSSAAPASALSQPTAAGPKIHIKFADDDKKKPAPAKPQERSTWNAHARYYAAITFNQIVLSTSEEDRKAARSLMDVYFQLFREVVGEHSGAIDADDKADEPEEMSAKDGKSRDKGRTPRPKDAKGKAKEVLGAAGFAEVQDESSRLVSAILTGVNRAVPFARFGGQDVEFHRHMDTLFLIVHTSTFNITLQALTLISHIVAALPPTASADPSSSSQGTVAARYFRTLYATLLDPRLFISNKHAMYLNLLFKSLKNDTNLERLKAFVKRFCQVLVGGFGGTEFIAGGLWLLGELFDAVPGLRNVVSKPPPAPSTDAEQDAYDPRKRDPQYAHASLSPLWELTPLLHHAHPTVSLLARQLLSRQPLTSSPDLSLHTLTHFLDRFVYKNPKKLKAKGASIMQPTSADGDGVRKLKGDLQEGPVNEEGWWRRSKGSVPLFFHQYFSKKHEKDTAKAAKVDKRRQKRGSDEEESGSELDAAGGGGAEDASDESDVEEDEIWKAMKASMPDVAGAEAEDDLSGDSDDLPSGLDDSDDEPELDASDAGGSEPNLDSDDEDEGIADSDGEDAFSLAEASDADDLVDLDDMPAGLVDFEGPESAASDAAPEEWSGFGAASGGKRKHEDDDKSRARKKKRALPTFASYEDYAKMIDDGSEDNI